MANQNGIIGDNDAFDLPITNVGEDTLVDEKKMAKFSKTAEFKRIKDYAQSRIKFYQDFLPDGRPLTSVDNDERGKNWVIANAVIGEFNLLLSEYEQAKEVVADAARRQPN